MFDVRATGTVRENRTSQGSSCMVSSRDMKKYARGVFDYRCDGKVFLLKWNDSAVVNIYSSWENQDPVKKSQKKNKRGSERSSTT